MNELVKAEKELRNKMVKLYGNFGGFWDLDEQETKEAHRQWIDMKVEADKLKKEIQALEEKERLGNVGSKAMTQRTLKVPTNWRIKNE